MSHPNLMEADVTIQKRPHHCDGHDEGTAAEEQNLKKVKQEVKCTTTGFQIDVQSNEDHSDVGLHPESDRGEVHSEDDLDQSEGPESGRFSLPAPSVNSMKSDHSKRRLPNFTGGSENTSEPLTESGHVTCAVCPKRAFKSCLTCMASYCELHVRNHYSGPVMQRHRLVDATEDLEQRLCQKHGRELELYCSTDCMFICVKCLVYNHNGHEITVVDGNQSLQKTEHKIAVPPPGPIEFTSVTPDSVCLCWGHPEGLTGRPRFRVTWTGEGNQLTLEVEDLKLCVQELTPGEKYTFTVVTITDCRKSLCVSATVQTDIPAPRYVNVNVNVTSVSVRWSKPAGVEQAIYLLILCSEGKTLQTISVKSLHHCFSELEFEREYTISVSTVLKGGQSKPISSTICTSVPVPERLQVGSVTPVSADLSWSHHRMEQIPHRFQISYHSEGTEPQTISTKSRRTQLLDLKPNTLYTVSVCCVIRDETKSQATSTTIQTAVPPPGPIEFTSVTPDSVCLCWGPPEGLTGSCRFRVSWMGNEPQEQREQLEMEDLKLSVQGLSPVQEYTFTVATLSHDDRCSTRVSGYVRTGVPVPQNLTVKMTPLSADLSWSLHQRMEQIPHSFLISYHSEGTEPQTITTESCSTTLTGLKPGTQYTVNVCCKVRESGENSQANTTTIQTK